MRAAARAASLPLQLCPVVAGPGDDGAVARGRRLAAEVAVRLRRRERDLPSAPGGPQTSTRRDKLALPSVPSGHKEEDDAAGGNRIEVVIFIEDPLVFDHVAQAQTGE